MAPFQIDRGLYLKKAQLLLPWDMLSEDLVQLSEAKGVHVERANAGALGWKDDEIFNGLKADVWYGVGGLKNVFQIHLQNVQQFATPRECFAFYRDSLTEQLGTPRLFFDRDVMENEYPHAEWWFDSVRVSLAVGERFVEYFAFLITKGFKKR